MAGDNLVQMPGTRIWWEMQPPVPLQCEVRSLHARCEETAEYVLTSLGKIGHCCARCLASQLVVLTRFGPVQVEKLP